MAASSLAACAVLLTRGRVHAPGGSGTVVRLLAVEYPVVRPPLAIARLCSVVTTKYLLLEFPGVFPRFAIPIAPPIASHVDNRLSHMQVKFTYQMS